VKIGATCSALLVLCGLPRQSGAQASGDSLLTEAALYSLYTKRVDNTITLANLALTGATDPKVREAAKNLAGEHQEARERTERIARDHRFSLAPPAHDTSDVLLTQVRNSLKGKTGRAFDSAWVNLAHQWLTTLILDNNRAVKPRVPGDLRPVAADHTTWLFHQLPAIDKLGKEFK